MKLLDLFLLALMPILKVLIVTAIGLLLATKRFDILGAEARSHLNIIVFYVFSPALIASNLADTITWESLSILWFMPVNILFTFVLGSVLGWILMKISKAPPNLNGLIIGCCSAGNIGNFLLIILPVLCKESGSPFGDVLTCSTNAKAYASLSLSLLAVYVWSYVYIVMNANSKINAIDKDVQEITVITVSERISDKFPPSPKQELLPSDGGTLEIQGQVETNHGSDGKYEGIGIILMEKMKQEFNYIKGHVELKMILAPSTVAAIIGFIIGLISPLRKVVIGDNAPLRSIYSSVELIGESTIPCITLVIGANLLKGLRASRVSASIIGGIVVIRFIILPASGVGIVKAAQHFGLIGSNSLFRFTLMLQYAVPPAMNIGTISQLLGTGQSECSVIMLWTYVLAILFMTIWSTIFIWLVS